MSETVRNSPPESPGFPMRSYNSFRALYRIFLAPEAVWREVVGSGLGRMSQVIGFGLARRAAPGLGLRVKGSAGLLMEAKKAGLIAPVRPFLETMERRGDYLSDRLIERASRISRRCPRVEAAQKLIEDMRPALVQHSGCADPPKSVTISVSRSSKRSKS